EVFTHGDAELRADELSRALEDPRFADDRRAMYATPLILTLLCVMNYRSCKMPESRVEFYETCLRVLLESWPDSKREGAGSPLEGAPRRGERAIDLLAPIAYELHASPSRDLLGRDALIVRINR